MTLSTPNLVIEQDEVDVPLSIPAPIGGWNTRDNVGSMPVEDAITLENIFPDTRGVKNRGGFTDWGVTGITGNIESLFEFKKTTTRTGLAAAGGKIYTWDVATSAQAATQIGTGFTNDRWQFLNTNQRTMMVNGADAPRDYDGTTLNTTSITGDLSGSEQNMNGIHKHKDRVFLWDTDDQSFYYSGAALYSGDYTEFPLDTIFAGNVKIITTVSQDTGSGLDDLLAIISDLGEVLLYTGSNPGDANDWALNQRYQIPRPIDVRAVTRFAGDAYVLVENDFIPLLRYVNTANPEGTKLTGAVTDAVDDYETNFGWQCLFYGKGKWLFLNVPVTENSTYHQYVINSVTGAACKFTGMNGNAFANANNRLFFGGNGTIYRADDGLNDDDANIATCKVQQAFTTIGTDYRKKFNLFQILLKSLGDITISQALAFDYGDALTPQVSSSTSTGSAWDISDWDTSSWSSENLTRLKVFVATGTGLSVSPVLELSIKDIDFEWYRSVYTFDILQT